MIKVPENIVNALCTVAELGADQVVTKRMADYDMIADACDIGWTMLQEDDEDWQALYWYKEGADPETDMLLAKVRESENDPWGRLEFIEALPGDNAWIIQVQCDSKRLTVDITSPHRQGVVHYVFSIKNDDVVISKDTLKSDVLNTRCKKHVQRQYEMLRIRRTDPDINENILRLFPLPIILFIL
jgi:hypothetical protein